MRLVKVREANLNPKGAHISSSSQLVQESRAGIEVAIKRKKLLCQHRVGSHPSINLPKDGIDVFAAATLAGLHESSVWGIYPDPRLRFRLFDASDTDGVPHASRRSWI